MLRVVLRNLYLMSFLYTLSEQDYTILVLRKSMFSREANTRIIAVEGLLDLIIADKQTRVHSNNNSESESWLRMSMSEPSSSQSGSQQVPRRGMSGRNKNLLQELLGILRRCLSQQVSWSPLLSTFVIRIGCIFARKLTFEHYAGDTEALFVSPHVPDWSSMPFTYHLLPTLFALANFHEVHEGVVLVGCLEGASGHSIKSKNSVNVDD